MAPRRAVHVMGAMTTQALLQVLQRYMSPITARGMVARANRLVGITGDMVPAKDVPRLLEQLAQGIKLFVPERQQQEAIAALQSINRDAAAPRAQVYDIHDERGVASARAGARDLCETLGGSSLASQKAATAVSEVARNIVLYAPSGRIEMTPVQVPRRALRIKATDSGPGIPHLNDVLSGKYHSKTGLGRGLSGVKRLSDRFNVLTGPAGTTVEFELCL